MSCGVGCRHSSDPVLLWLWHRPMATALIWPLAWEPPYGTGVAQEKAERQKKKKKESLLTTSTHLLVCKKMPLTYFSAYLKLFFLRLQYPLFPVSYFPTDTCICVHTSHTHGYKHTFGACELTDISLKHLQSLRFTHLVSGLISSACLFGASRQWTHKASH